MVRFDRYRASLYRRAVHAHALLRLAAYDGSRYEQGDGVNRKRVQRLMRRLGLWGAVVGALRR
ncbi:MAG: IS3 family transposase [Gammaproteobacteria bacterium]